MAGRLFGGGCTGAAASNTVGNTNSQEGGGGKGGRGPGGENKGRNMALYQRWSRPNLEKQYVEQRRLTEYYYSLAVQNDRAYNGVIDAIQVWLETGDERKLRKIVISCNMKEPSGGRSFGRGGVQHEQEQENLLKNKSKRDQVAELEKLRGIGEEAVTWADTYRNDAEKLKNDNNQLKEEAQTHMNESLALQEEVRKLKMRITDLETAVRAANQTIRERESHIAYLEAKPGNHQKATGRTRGTANSAAAQKQVLQAEVASLETALDESKRHVEDRDDSIAALQRQLDNLNERFAKATNQRDIAEEERGRLFRLLQGATVKRSDAPRNSSLNPGLPAFPTGDEINHFLQKMQEKAGDFLHSLHDALMDWGGYNGPTDPIGSYGLVLNRIIVQSWNVAADYVDDYEDEKLRSLSWFLGGYMTHTEMKGRVETENTLLQLFWKYAMQEVVKNLPQKKGYLLEGRLRSCDDDAGVGAGDGSQEVMEGVGHGDHSIEVGHGDHLRVMQQRFHRQQSAHLSELTDWACREETNRALSELEAPSWESFTEDLVLLALFCKFSDPVCYLWPDIGHEVPYSPDAQKLENLVGVSGRKKPKPGDLVRVLLPGLYFVDPTPEGGVEPKAKAIVVSLPQSNTR